MFKAILTQDPSTNHVYLVYRSCRRLGLKLWLTSKSVEQTLLNYLLLTATYSTGLHVKNITGSQQLETCCRVIVRSDLLVIGDMISEKLAEDFVILTWVPSCRQTDD